MNNRFKANKVCIGIISTYCLLVLLVKWISLDRFLSEGTGINTFAGNCFWQISLIGLIMISIYCLKMLNDEKKNKLSYAMRFFAAIDKYSFLLEQLLARDFKTKYKRSFFGVIWSLLNPMLTMGVQYVVFSTLFKSDVEYFPIYLLSGIVMFGFFSEACGIGISSITGNASLITKVYMPKYIYPTARTFSSAINLLISFIPLFIMVVFMGVPINKSILLVPFGIVCLIIFCWGMSLILSTAMVFFRDTQFLWGIVSMLWMYATPIFYPENIWPAQFIPVLKLNPLYHFIRFIRICIIDGKSPDAQAFIYCIVFSIGTFLIGCIVFKKNQDKFVLNL